MEVEQEVDWEYALHDLMDNICKYLNAKALCNLAKVSKSWRVAALREIARRCYIQQLSFSYECNNLTSMLHINPSAMLLICDIGMEKYLRNRDSDRKEILKHFEKNLPLNNVAFINVTEYLTTDDMKFEGTDDQYRLELTGNCNFLGLFFPNLEQCTCVQVAYADQDVNDCYRIGRAVDEFADDLGLIGSERPKSIILLFADLEFHDRERFVNDLQSRIQNGKDTIWACNIRLGLWRYTQDYNWIYDEDDGDYEVGGEVVALRISGPKIEYWTAIIEISELSWIEQKLYELKEKVTVRQHHCTGLLHAPHDGFFNHELMRSVKRIFPYIPFTGLFMKPSWVRITNEFARRRTRRYNDTVSKLRKREISIIIISYN